MDEIKYVDFEFLKMPITANYDEHLRRKYGDYMTPPPMSDRNKHNVTKL